MEVVDKSWLGNNLIYKRTTTAFLSLDLPLFSHISATFLSTKILDDLNTLLEYQHSGFTSKKKSNQIR